MDAFTISCFGHRVISQPLLMEQRFESLVKKFLSEKEYVAFLIGRDGEFDQIVSSTVRRCKCMIRDDNSALVWVLPYQTAAFRNDEESFRKYYDEIEIYENSANNHFKGAFHARNRAMVDRSDLVIFCVEHDSGGAWQTMKYAKKQGVPYINIYDAPVEEAE